MVFRASYKKTLISGIAVIAVFIFLYANGGFKSISRSSYGILKYSQAYAAKAAFFLNNAVSYIGKIKNLSNENARLSDENNNLKAEISGFKEVKHENEMLRSVLNLPIAREHSLIDASIVGKDPYFFSNVIIVDRGSDFGVGEGMDVVDSNGFFVGKVAEASASISKIRTIFDNSSSISAIDQETRTQGIIKYDLSDGLILDMVSQTENVAVNDTTIAFLSGNSLALPIAKVVSVEKFPNKPFQKIKLFPLSDFKKMEKVWIVIK